MVLNSKVPTWADVLSSIPQGSVLGLVLFVLYNNDLHEALVPADIDKLFADDTKVGKEISGPESRDELQQH